MSRSEQHQYALQAIISGDHSGAEAILAALIASDSGDAHSHMLLGRLAADRRLYHREMEMIQAAMSLAPGNPDYIAQLGRCYARAQAVEPALALAERALAYGPLSDLTLDAIAGIHTRFGQHRRAAEILTRAVAAGSRNAAIHFNLGSSLKFTGDFVGARRAFEQAILIAPSYHKAHAALTSLGGITADDNHLDRLAGLIAATDDPRARIHLCHAASKECEALGRYAESWDWLTTGKAVLSRAVGADPAATLSLLDSIPAAFGSFRSAPSAGRGPGRPIFIVGMPRSGTTVVDRILSNHSQITSIGEFQYFSQLLKHHCDSRTRHLIDRSVIALLADGSDLTAIGDAYVARATEVAGTSDRFVDKFHLNFMLVGHILRALPEARIVCLIRDPLDTIVSNYRQLFEFDTPIYNYSLDLASTTRFTIRFRRLAALWADVAPDRFMALGYEALVENPDAHGRRLLNFCGLDWEDGCTRIERNTSAVATASAVQVRQPINRSSIGNWRRYESYLDEAKALLAATGLLSD